MQLFDRLLSVITAVVLAVVGALVALEVVHTAVLRRAGHLVVPWESYAAGLRQHTWSAGVVVTVSAVVAVVGLVLLIAELRRRNPALLTLTPMTQGVQAGTTRGSLRRALAAKAAEVDGVSTSSASVKRRTATITAVTGLRDPGDLEQRITRHVSDWLAGLGLVSAPSVRARLDQRER